MTAEFEPQGWWAAVAAGVAAVPVAFLKYKSMLRDDKGGEIVHAAGADLIAGLRAQIGDLLSQVSVLTERCDRFAAERNDARDAENALRVEVATLTLRLEHVESEKSALRDLIAQAEARYKEIQKENETLRQDLAGIRKMLRVSSDELRPEAR